MKALEKELAGVGGGTLLEESQEGVGTWGLTWGARTVLPAARGRDGCGWVGG